MKTLAFVTSCVALIAITMTFVFNSDRSSQNSFVNSDSSSDTVVNVEDNSEMRDFQTFTSQQSSSSSSGYQQSSLNLSAANLRQPHMLTVNTSGNRLSGEITVNGKVVKRLNDNQVEINLSPFLSAGEHTVEISGRYAPASSSVSVELSAPGTNISQQTSGNGVLNYTLDVTVR